MVEVAEALNNALPNIGDMNIPAETSEERKSLKTRLWIFVPLWLVFLLAAGVMAFYNYRLDDRIAGWSVSQRLPALAGIAAGHAPVSAKGETASLDALGKDVDTLSSLMKALDQGGNFGRQWVAPVSDALRPALAQLLPDWKAIDKEALLLKQSRKELEGAWQRLATLRPAGEELARAALEAGAKAPNPLLVDFALRIETLNRGLDRLGSPTDAGAMAPEQAQAALQTLGDLLHKISAGGNPPPRFDALAANFDRYRQGVREFAALSPSLRLAGQAAERIQSKSANLAQNAETLVGLVAEERAAIGVNRMIVIVFFGLSTVFMVAAMATYLASARKRSLQLDREHRQNQDAIMRLMDELAVIAEGDLTMRAEVTENITGAIADSLNFTVEEIHALVLRINDAAEQIDEASRHGRQAAEELRLASERQSGDVRSATASVAEMAESVAEVAGSAEAILKVAGQSLNAAEQGADAVQKTISGMNVIRDSIQDTSKRIKRLGESSQEIGEIVDLISGIAEQTSVLALNAAIQAASAGEAGRGFAIVAEEVQRLAERSAEATKQIGALVNAIQNDAKGAVAAMEKSTGEVVEGTRLSDGAGEKLAEIQKISRKLAELIASVTEATKSQELSAAQTTRKMHDILQITNLTGQETQDTATSMQKLADLASALQLAVAGFKV